jgi:hypothetical protein
VLGERDLGGLAYYSYRDLQRGNLLPTRFLPMETTDHLKRLELDATTYLVNGRLQLFTFGGDLRLLRANQLGPRFPVLWTGLSQLPEDPFRLLVVSSRGLTLVDLKRRNPLKNHRLDFEAKGVALVGEVAFLAEDRRSFHDAPPTTVFHAFRVRRASDGSSKGPPEYLGKSEPIPGSVYHLVRAMGAAFAGVESVERGMLVGRVYRLSWQAGKLAPSEEARGGIRLMVGTKDLLLVDGTVYRSSQGRLLQTARLGSPRTVDGSSYFGDIREKHILMPSMGMRFSGGQLRCLEEEVIESW